MKLNLSNTWLKLGASLSATLISSNAFAQTTDLSSMSNTVHTQLSNVPQVIQIASYIAGTGFGMAGVMKLKAHAENPGQTPLAHGVGRIATGAALVALPWGISTAIGTIGGDNGGITQYKTNQGL